MKRFLIISGTVLAVLLAGLTVSVFEPLDREMFRRTNIHSQVVVDRHRQVLREFLNDEQGRGEWVPLDRIAPVMIEATIAVEDRRFRLHPGVDPVSVVRAVWSNLFRSGERSGASTITQQVIRNVYHHPRTFPNKVLEMWYALRLERMMTKQEVLEQYLNRAPYGNQLFGVQAAARYYFGKPAADLSPAEAAFLAGLPNAPTLLNPLSHFDRAMERQRSILIKLKKEGAVTEEEFLRAAQQPITMVQRELRFRAPHAVEMVRPSVSGIPDAAVVRTTIDLPLQSDIQWIVKGHLAQLKDRNVTNAAVVVLHNTTGEVRVLLGSADYFDDEAQGQINGAMALRQPGSSVKLFTYGTALGSGFTPSSLIADLPTAIPNEGGDYVPENYDRTYHGPVLLRNAFACSYNIPAVRVLHAVGVDAVYQRMITAGITTLTESPKHYGVGLTLGNAEVRLLELTNAYRAVANGGKVRPVHLLDSVFTWDASPVPVPPMPFERTPEAALFTPEISALLTDILSDPVARRPAFGAHFTFPFPCAVKTGTTKDYKDNWTIGFTTEYTVGVWAGNFSATPMRRVSGVTGAGQIFTDVMNLLDTKYGMSARPFTVPSGVVSRKVCALSGAAPGPYCRSTRSEIFLRSAPEGERCSVHRAYHVTGPNGEPERVVFTVWPGEYRTWVASEMVPQPPPGARMMGTARNEREVPLSIISPHPGDIFKVDPVLRKDFQTVRIETSIPLNATQVRLEVGRDESLPVTSSTVEWKLRRGDHRLRLVSSLRGKRITSAPVDIHVE